VSCSDRRCGSLSLLEGSGLDFLDLHRPMSAAPHAETFFYPDGGHLELAGHRFVGERIAEKLASSFAGRTDAPVNAKAN
jgi:hypothetical protein